MLVSVIGYLVLACGVLALVVFHELRSALRRHALASIRWVRATIRIVNAAVSRVGKDGVRTVCIAGAHLFHRLYERRAISLAQVSALIVPPFVAFSLSGMRTLDGFNDAPPPHSRAVVAALLDGDRLVAPEPLPPDVFVTAEVERMRPGVADADRRWDLLDNDFRQLLLRVYKVMHDEHGYDMVLLEGYRSPERQTRLAALGPAVTNAAAWQSMHQYGRAADSAFMLGGKLVISERDPWTMQGYKLFGEAAKKVGLVWGGGWKNMDLGHVELSRTRAASPDDGD